MYPLKSTQLKMRMLGFRVDGTSTGVKEVSTVQCVADVAGSLNNKYFLLYSALDAVAYYVWFNVSGGGVDPALANKTAIPVAISTGDGANTVAAAVQAAVDALAAFVATVNTDTVTITNASDGATTDASAGNSGFTVTVTTAGVTSSISISEGYYDATLSEGTGAGDYTLTFSQTFARTPTVILGCLTSNTILQIASVSTTAVNIKAFQGTDGTTAKDADFHALVFGDMAPDAR